MKKYIQPCLVVVRLQHHSIICSSTVRGFSCSEDIDYVGGGSGDAYARESSGVWDDEW
jgi:hypothetical protein